MRPGLFLTVALALAGTRAAAQSDVAVVLDTNGAIHGGFPLQSAFCRETAKRFLQVNPDQFDGVVTFTTRSLSDLENVQQGTPVMLTAQGISTSPSFNFSASYGSNNKLAQCVFMGSLQKLPNNPDGPVQVFFGLPLGLTGVELVGHEYGHHWLLWLMYDKADGRGPQHLLRGYESGSPNGHYNYHADSHSVMYGNFITDHGNGSFTLAGGDRKYGHLDQYLMGLRAPNETADTFLIDDGSGEGNPAVAIPKGQTATKIGTRVDVTVDDVIRAMGPRVPSSATAQKCWRVAFILVAEQGTTPTAAQLDKVDAYRRRFEQWFTWATDGRGTMDTRLDGTGCGTPAMPDAGMPEDAGTTPSDAGSDEDAGSNDDDAGAGDTDAGLTGGADAGGGTVDAGSDADGDDIGTLKPGCGCVAADGSVLWLALLGMGAAAARSRRRR